MRLSLVVCCTLYNSAKNNDILQLLFQWENISDKTLNVSKREARVFMSSLGVLWHQHISLEHSVVSAKESLKKLLLITKQIFSAKETFFRCLKGKQKIILSLGLDFSGA